MKHNIDDAITRLRSIATGLDLTHYDGRDKDILAVCDELEKCKRKLKLTQDELDDVQGRLDDADEFGSDCAALILSHTGEVPMKADDFVSITDLEQLLIAHKAKEEDERAAADPVLKPCPFCGASEACKLKRSSDVRPVRYWLYCAQCGAHGPLAESVEDAVSAWDRRHPYKVQRFKRTVCPK